MTSICINSSFNSFLLHPARDTTTTLSAVLRVALSVLLGIATLGILHLCYYWTSRSVTDQTQVEKGTGVALPIPSPDSREITDAELQQLIGVEMSKVADDPQKVQSYLSVKGRIAGFFKLYYTEERYLTDMSQFISAAHATGMRSTVEDSMSTLVALSTDKRKAALVDIKQKNQKYHFGSGYHPEMVRSLLSVRYADQLLLESGHFFNQNSTPATVPFIVMDQIGPDEPSSSVPDQVYQAMVNYLTPHAGVLTRALFIPCAVSNHTVLIVVERDPNDRQIFISILDSMGPGERYRKADLRKAITRAFGQFFNPVKTVELNGPNQNNLLLCGVHVQMNLAVLSKAVSQGESVYSILRNTKRTRLLLPERNRDELVGQFRKDKAIAKRTLEMILNWPCLPATKDTIEHEFNKFRNFFDNQVPVADIHREVEKLFRL